MPGKGQKFMQSEAASGRVRQAETETLATYVAEAKVEALPEKVRKEAARTFLNWVGCAVGGARHEAERLGVPFLGEIEASGLTRCTQH